MTRGVSIPEKDWPHVQRLIALFKRGKVQLVGEQPGSAPAPVDPRPMVCVLLQELAPGGTAAAMVMREEREAVVWDLWLTGPTAATHFELSVGTDTSPSLSVTATADQLRQQLLLWAPLRDVLLTVDLGQPNLKRWRLILSADRDLAVEGAPLAPGRITLQKTRFVSTGTERTVVYAGAPTTALPIPIGTEGVAQHVPQIGWVFEPREHVVTEEDVATETPDTCCGHTRKTATVEDCALLGEDTQEFWEITQGGFLSGVSLAHDTACEWFSDEFEVACGSTAVQYTARLEPRAGVSSLTGLHADYFRLTIQPVGGLGSSGAAPSRCRQKLVYYNLRKFHPRAANRFALDPQASQIYYSHALPAPCELCLMPLTNPRFVSVEPESQQQQRCLRQQPSPCDLSELFEPDLIPKAATFTVPGWDIGQRSSQYAPFFPATVSLGLSGCSHIFDKSYNLIRCTSGWMTADYLQDRLFVKLGLCSQQLKIEIGGTRINCSDSALTIGWTKEVLYAFQGSAPWDFTAPLSLDLVSASHTEHASSFSGGGSTTTDETPLWQAALPTVTLEPVT